MDVSANKGRRTWPTAMPMWWASTSARCPARALVVRVSDGAEAGTAVASTRTA